MSSFFFALCRQDGLKFVLVLSKIMVLKILLYLRPSLGKGKKILHKLLTEIGSMLIRETNHRYATTVQQITTRKQAGCGPTSALQMDEPSIDCTHKRCLSWTVPEPRPTDQYPFPPTLWLVPSRQAKCIYIYCLVYDGGQLGTKQVVPPPADFL